MPVENSYVSMISTLSRTLILTVALATPGCGPSDGPQPARPASVTELESPAGPASGEGFVSADGHGAWMSWLQESPSGGHDLWVARFEGGRWAEPSRVASGTDFFVNWADFPSVVPDGHGRLWAHWLQRGGGSTYDYGVRLAWSDDGGATWSEPWTPHEDGAPQEHGFVSILPLDEGVGVTWLDGRKYSGWPQGQEPVREMTLRFRATTGAAAGPEVLLDGRTCDCCQTDAAMAADGPVVVYRDRSEGEIRDIALIRMVSGEWTEPTPVHEDGWEIGGCPVNGPAVVADGHDVAVAWFTGAGDQPRVKVAFSEDGGASFGAPVQVDDGNPAGRVDLLRLHDGSVLVSWLESLGDQAADVRFRRVTPDGSAGAAYTIARSAAARGSGFPRLTLLADGTVLAVWTDIDDDAGTRVRVARVEVTDS